MASPHPAKPKLRLNVPVIRKESDPAFYIVPPVLLVLVFAFCAYVPRAEKKSEPVAAAPQQTVVETPAEPVKEAVVLEDPNVSLPDFTIPSGMKNLLVGATDVRVSSPGKDAPAANAVDGSCENDVHVAVAMPGSGENAWWQVEVPAGQELAAERLVVYGGGSKSPVGKFLGGFSVEVQYADGGVDAREFCKEGFALEGYETWKLKSSQGVQRVRVTALKPDAPVVLREVQLIGPAAEH